MPGLEEVLHYLTGVWLLIRRNPEGYRYLDFTDQGVARSFWSIGWSLPFLFVTWVWGRSLFLNGAPPHADPGLILYFRFFMIDMATWFTPLLILIGFSILTRLEQSFAAVVVTTNWLTLPLNVVAGVIALLEVLFPGGGEIWVNLWIIQFIVSVTGLYLLLWLIYQKQALIAVTVTVILIIPGVLMSESLHSFLGIVVN